MKKLWVAIFSIALAFSMTACASKSKVDERALDAFVEAVHNMKNITSTDYELAFQFKQAQEHTKASVKGSYVNDNKQPAFSAALDLVIADQPSTEYANAYFKDNTLYYDIPLMGLKQKMPLDSILSLYATDESNKKITGMNKKDIKPYVKAAEYKNDTITLKIDPAKMADKQVDKTLQSIANVDVQTEYKEITAIMKLKDTLPAKLEINVVYSTKMNETTNQNNLNVIINLKNINKINKISFPDFTDYDEADNSLFG